MRRVVIFATLALLLLAVAGVTVAQEGAFRNGESTLNTPEVIAPELTTPETTAPEATEPDPDILEATTPEATKPETPEPEQPAANGPGQPEADKPDKGQGGGGAVEQDPEETDGEETGDGAGRPADEVGGQEKVAVCHKGKKTLSVGASALDAHLRHGDVSGACG